MRAPLFNLLLAACLLAGAGAAQRREFLTPAEVDEVREAQEPADRMKLYVQFARVRLDTLDKEMAKESAERGAVLHDLLYEYDRIIDALDGMAELGISKRALVRRGLDAAVRAEPEFLKRLQALEAKNPKDLEDYRFILRQAIESTESSLVELRTQLGKLPADKKEDRRLEKEAQKEEQKRKKNEKPPPK